MISPRYLVAYLRGTAVITDAVGTVTIGDDDLLPIVSEIDAPLTSVMPRRAIQVTSAGGPAVDGRTNTLTVGRQDVKCYGRTIGEAWALHDVVYNHLRYSGQKTMSDRQVIATRPTAGGMQDREKDTDWPYVWMEYTITLNEAALERGA